MKRYGQVIRLRPECREEYVAMHEAVWPEVLATIAACNIENYSIFMVEGLLFAYMEYVGTNYEADMDRMAACPDTQRWWKLTDAMQEPFGGTAPGRLWRVMDEVFHFEGRRPVLSMARERGSAGRHPIEAEETS